MTIAVLLFGFSTLPPGDTGTLATFALLGMAIASATQDIAADAYGIEVLPARSVGQGGGIKVGAYRVGLLLAGGLLAGRADALGWPGVWRVAAGAFALFAASTFFLPSVPRRHVAGTPIVEPLRSLLRTPGILGIAAFVLLFKAGDYAMPSSLTKAMLVQARRLLEQRARRRPHAARHRRGDPRLPRGRLVDQPGGAREGPARPGRVPGGEQPRLRGRHRRGREGGPLAPRPCSSSSAPGSARRRSSRSS